MPIYEYKCPECASISEFILKFSDPAPSECPACGQTVAMVKQMSATNFHLKGGGWYKDKYDSASNRPPEDKGGDKAAGSGDSAADGGAAKGAEPAKGASPAKESTGAPSSNGSSSSAPSSSSGSASKDS